MSNHLTIADAERILWELSDLDSDTATSDRRSQICEALDYLTKQADYHIFGICAETTQDAMQALQNYTVHFRYELPAVDLPDIADGIYLKYNPRSRRYHCDNYQGTYRGVLISFHTDFTDGYSGTQGHFPLDLF
ncbi:DUF1824 family protein [Pseudanabaena mucicola]|uniref:DUF1824 family protein n=1 Tax=Pseudanabaena mucicola FACHB-723 TaxID=2692860 RepID=A0ABR8A0A9_9CYAN|nr:DUF1824 family protein [Pseudanabaena mucicola]MBD2189686.1 DUF1824 family protein [Pseudanabaena mucicola FACHB-723]